MHFDSKKCLQNDQLCSSYTFELANSIFQVAILTNEAPTLPPRGSSPLLSDFKGGKGDVDMQDLSSSFPVTNFYELENRVFKDDWSIPYRRDESLGRCLVAATKLAKESLSQASGGDAPVTCLMEQDEHCRKFLDRILPEVRC